MTRGIKIHDDLAHELGIKAFPAIPKTMTSGICVTNSTLMINEESNGSFDMNQEELDEKGASDIEIRLAIRDNIDSLTIPG